MENKTITISKEAFDDILRVRNEFDAIMESLELMKNKEFMDSYKKTKEEIKNRNFSDWDAL